MSFSTVSSTDLTLWPLWLVPFSAECRAITPPTFKFLLFFIYWRGRWLTKILLFSWQQEQRRRRRRRRKLSGHSKHEKGLQVDLGYAPGPPPPLLTLRVEGCVAVRRFRDCLSLSLNHSLDVVPYYHLSSIFRYLWFIFKSYLFLHFNHTY